jgi:hypothetical protein
MLVGITMALTIIVCLLAFIWIYTKLGPLLSDFIPHPPAATATPSAKPSAPASSAPASSGSQSTAPAASASQSPESQDSAWKPTHQITGAEDINFRADATSSSNSLGVLAPGTKLKFLGDQVQTNGETWMHFETQQGTKGWVRSIDVTAANA